MRRRRAYDARAVNPNSVHAPPRGDATGLRGALSPSGTCTEWGVTYASANATSAAMRVEMGEVLRRCARRKRVRTAQPNPPPATMMASAWGEDVKLSEAEEAVAVMERADAAVHAEARAGVVAGVEAMERRDALAMRRVQENCPPALTERGGQTCLEYKSTQK